MPWFLFCTGRKALSKYAVEAATQDEAWDRLVEDQANATSLGELSYDESGYEPVGDTGYASLEDALASHDGAVDD